MHPPANRGFCTRQHLSLTHLLSCPAEVETPAVEYLQSRTLAAWPHPLQRGAMSRTQRKPPHRPETLACSRQNTTIGFTISLDGRWVPIDGCCVRCKNGNPGRTTAPVIRHPSYRGNRHAGCHNQALLGLLYYGVEPVSIGRFDSLGFRQSPGITQQGLLEVAKSRATGLGTGVPRRAAASNLRLGRNPKRPWTGLALGPKPWNNVLVVGVVRGKIPV